MIDIKVLKSIKDIGLFRNEWNNLLERSNCNYIYSTPEWVECWYEAFGFGSEIQIIAALKQDRLVGLLPMILRKAPLKDLGGRRMEFVSGPQGDCHDAIIERGLDCNVIPMLLESMLKYSIKTNLFILHHIVKESNTLSFIFDSFHKNNYKVAIQEETAPYLCLDSTKDEIEKNWSKKHKTDLRRQHKRLRNLGSLEFVIYSKKEQILELLKGFFETHKLSWESRGYKSRLGYDYLMQTFLKNLIHKIGVSECKKRIHFSTLNLNGNPISYHFGFLYNDHFYYYIPTYDKQYENFSPGKIHLLFLIEHGIENGWRLFDFLNGNEPYKYSWTKDSKKKITLIASKGISLSSLRRWWLVPGKEHARNLSKLVRSLRTRQ